MKLICTDEEKEALSRLLGKENLTARLERDEAGDYLATFGYPMDEKEQDAFDDEDDERKRTAAPRKLVYRPKHSR